jgi:hypothetical protein
MDNTVTTAAVAAVVATATTLVVTQIRKANIARAQQLEVTEAQSAGYTRGWFEGREKMQEERIANMTPMDITGR